MSYQAPIAVYHLGRWMAFWLPDSHSFAVKNTETGWTALKNSKAAAIVAVKKYHREESQK